MMEIAYTPTAQKQLLKLPQAGKIKALRIVRKLAVDPFAGKHLKGQLIGLCSAKAWPYRIIYRFLNKKKLIIIETIEHRQGIYK